MPNFKDLLGQYYFKFPKQLIAKTPASPRDSARLLVYERKNGEISYDNFLNLPKYLPANAVLVFNQTKVIPARIEVTKETGGKARLLYLETTAKGIKVMSDRKLNVGAKVFVNKRIYFTVAGQEERFYFLKTEIDRENVGRIFEVYGTTPLPPYIKNSPLSEKKLREKYQAIFAKYSGSVAAPTASLHFTNRLLRKLEAHGVAIKYVTLHVNLGTFAPLTEEHVQKNALHKEYYEIDKETAQFLNKAKRAGRPIIAVGTTVLRTLESASNTENQICSPIGATDLFIREGYKMKMVDGLITNFHVPKSSLLMLVSALIGREKTLEIYKKAISKKFRLFSFGDGMLITRID